MPTVDGYPVGLQEEDLLRAPTRPLTIMVGPQAWAGGLLSGIKGATGLPSWGTPLRDTILRDSPHLDGMWASALNMAITKHIALGSQLTDSEDAGRRLARAHDVVQSYDQVAMARGLRDYLTTNIGQVIAILRSGRGPAARIDRLVHLDSLRCQLTTDARYPVIYQTWRGEWRLIPDHDLIRLVDMPSAVDLGTALPMGLCAADRAWETVLKLAAMETYYREKVSGSRNLAIHIIRGLSYKQIHEALTTTDEAQDARGFVLYRGSTIVPVMSDTEVQLTTIPLAEIPDGFTVVDERRDAYLRLANAIGMFVGELQPLSGQGLGTGTQTVILDEAAEGRGLASWRASFAQQINDRATPPTVTFTWTNLHDTRDRKAKAEADGVRIAALAQAVAAQAITPAQMANILADDEIIPRQFVAADQTPGGVLADDDKSEELDAEAQATDAAALAALAAEPAAAPAATTKARRTITDADADALVAAALKDQTAWDWARRALAGDEA